MASPATVNEQTLLNANWAAFRAQVAAGNQQLVLPDNVPNSIIQTIANRYSQLIATPVSTISIPSLRIIRFTAYAGTVSPATSPAITSPASPSSSTDSPEPKVKAKVPRPPNAFILYRQYYHPIIKEEFPGIMNNDISKKVAAMWKVEDEDVKASWKAKAEEVKEEHLKQNPGYSYQPRKSSEKKRRKTKRKVPEVNVPAAQLPLPTFSNSNDISTLANLTYGQDDSAVQTFGQATGQSNNLMPAFDFSNMQNYDYTGSIMPFAQMANVNGGFGGGYANLGLDSFLAPRPDEQARQQKLGEESAEWSAFVEANI